MKQPKSKAKTAKRNPGRLQRLVRPRRVPVVKPMKGVCDFCGDYEIEVIDLGEIGRGICGFCACKACCIKANHPWPNDQAEP